MKTISLLVYEDAVLSSISGAIDLLTATNAYLKQLGKPAAFSIELVGEKERNIQLNVPAHFVCTKTLDGVTDPTLILIPAFYSSPDEALAKDKAMIAGLGQDTPRAPK